MKTKYTLLFILMLSFICCIGKQRPDKVIGNNEENFDKFIKVFYSDSLFQMSRIIFPLSSDLNDTLSNDSEQFKSPVLNRENWRILKDIYFKENDSIVNIDGEIFKRKFVRNYSNVEESIYIENSGFFINIKFTLQNGKWYLIDYIESND
jgi:hypothetical protein